MFNFRFETNKPPEFVISPYLVSVDAEILYIRQLSELFIMFLLPRCYSLAPATHLLREVLACKSKFFEIFNLCIEYYY